MGTSSASHDTAVSYERHAHAIGYTQVVYLRRHCSTRYISREAHAFLSKQELTPTQTEHAYNMLVGLAEQNTHNNTIERTMDKLHTVLQEAPKPQTRHQRKAEIARLVREMQHRCWLIALVNKSGARITEHAEITHTHTRTHTHTYTRTHARTHARARARPGGGGDSAGPRTPTTPAPPPPPRGLRPTVSCQRCCPQASMGAKGA